MSTPKEPTPKEPTISKVLRRARDGGDGTPPAVPDGPMGQKGRVRVRVLPPALSRTLSARRRAQGRPLSREFGPCVRWPQETTEGAGTPAPGQEAS
jgi:hypothetical protein